MALKAVTTTVCKKCGSREVAWQQSKAGKWYLAETTKGRNGVRYPSAPHFKTCERLQRVQAEAQVEAERRTRWEAMSPAEQLAEAQRIFANG